MTSSTSRKIANINYYCSKIKKRKKQKCNRYIKYYFNIL